MGHVPGAQTRTAAARGCDVLGCRRTPLSTRWTLLARRSGMVPIDPESLLITDMGAAGLKGKLQERYNRATVAGGVLTP
jgi:hypothetical protein